MSGYPSRSGAGFDEPRSAAERYRIIGRIAAGGMAEIYLARMLTGAGVEREVVLKRLMPELQGDHEFVQMFHDEARIASQMKHPNIVQIYELGELDGSLFISMELLRGVNLRDLLARLHRRGATLPTPLAVRIACGALDALAYAHRFTDHNGRLLNVVHRDVSPQNIIVTYEGTVKLVDFGVAKAEGRLHQTRAGLIKGKFAYMSPEQISGGKVDGRSDIFALAEVFYELLLRRHPFYAKTDMDVLRGILDADPPHPSALDPTFPPELGAILMRGMRKLPADRWPHAGAMQEAMERFLQSERTPATTLMLGRWVRELFADRVSLEQEARERGDDALLIESMTAGRNEPSAEQPPPKRSMPDHPTSPRAPMSEQEVTDRAILPAAGSGVRDQVVEISQDDAVADDAAPAFLAHSGYTDPGVRRRRAHANLQSEVRRLFDDPADLMTPAEQSPRLLGAGLIEDSGEAPTQTGALSEAQLADIRGLRTPKVEAVPAAEPHAPVATAPSSAPAQPAAARAQVVPVVLGKPTSTRPSREDSAQVAPAERPAAPAVTRRAPPTPAASSAAALTSPAARPSAPGSGPSAASAQDALSARSQTVKTEEVEHDRWGLLLFVAGLGALVGAIIYAILLYAGAQSPMMRMVVSSTPSGAAIYLNGADTGARTPQIFNNIPANQENVVELHLGGYEPHVRKLPVSADGTELLVDWRFREVARAPSGQKTITTVTATRAADGR